MKQKFDITGMTCSACSTRVEKSVSKLSGVSKTSVNLLTNSMQIEYDEKQLNDEKIIQTVVHEGYGASIQGKQVVKKVEQGDDALKAMRFRLWISFAFLIPLFYISMGSMVGMPIPAFLNGQANALSFAFIQFLLCLPIVYVNRQYFIVGFKTLFHGSPNMDSLIAIGSTAAIVYGIYAIFMIGYGLGHQEMMIVHQYHMDLYFESAATILALITLGKYLETKSKGKTSEAITKLMNLAPQVANVERNGDIIEVAIDEVVVHDIIVVKPGERIPVDGTIVQGQTSIDESMISGESLPVAKEVNDKVIAATMNKAGYIHFEATHVGSDTTLSKIIQLVEEASSSKAPIAKMADKIAGIFVPVVIGIAILATIIWYFITQDVAFSLSIGIAVLVISCPCALGLATPVAIMVGTGKGAESGILIKSGDALETAHSVNCVVLDKTGTITEGKPVVTDLISFESGVDVLAIVASLEKQSEHPLAEAIMKKAEEQKVSELKVEKFEAIFGQGIMGEINHQKVYAGNMRLMEANNIDTSEHLDTIEMLSEAGKTPLLIADEKKVIGIIGVADIVKQTSREAIKRFEKMGIEVIMLSGDRQKTADAIAKVLHINRAIGDVLPADKEQEIVKLQASGKIVAMIGDGINDAPALMRADVGIAIGAGSDVAIDSADIVLMRSDLLDAVSALRLSKAVIRNIKQNLFWAFFYNSVGIPLAAGVFYGLLNWKLNPIFAAAAMSLSSVCVVSNALRLKFFKEDKIDAKAEGESKMTIVKIEGMMCNHCVNHVNKALNQLNQVQVEVDLEKKEARITHEQPLDHAQIVALIKEAGYEVISIQEA